MSLESILTNTAKATLLANMEVTHQAPLTPPSPPHPSVNLRRQLPAPPIHVIQEGNWPASFQASIDTAFENAWSQSTVKNYAYGVRKFLTFCQENGIPSEQTFPACDYLVCAFIASQQRTVSKSTINNFLSAIKAWHTRNGYSFSRSDRLSLLAKASRPLANKNPPRHPVTLDMLGQLLANLQICLPFDACVYACACVSFWGLARLGELLPDSCSYDKTTPPFPSRSHISSAQLGAFKIFLPWTKVKHWNGEEIYLTTQNGGTDPIVALKNHLYINTFSKDTLLFSFSKDGAPQVLQKSHFLRRCNDIWTMVNPKFPRTTGHSFRIGGTSHLLLSGVPPEIIKTTGRWSSNSFHRYWRHLDVVIPRHVSNLPNTSAIGG